MFDLNEHQLIGRLASDASLYPAREGKKAFIACTIAVTRTWYANGALRSKAEHFRVKHWPASDAEYQRLAPKLTKGAWVRARGEGRHDTVPQEDNSHREVYVVYATLFEVRQAGEEHPATPQPATAVETPQQAPPAPQQQMAPAPAPRLAAVPAPTPVAPAAAPAAAQPGAAGKPMSPELKKALKDIESWG